MMIMLSLLAGATFICWIFTVLLDGKIPERKKYGIKNRPGGRRKGKAHE